MVNCSVLGCTNYSHRTCRCHFFIFPKNSECRQIWTKGCNRPMRKGREWTPSQYSRICSEHFHSSSYERDPLFLEQFGYIQAKPKLRDDATPTIFGEDLAGVRQELQQRGRCKLGIAEKQVQQQVLRKVALDGDQAVECELCGESFGNNQSLMDHFVKLHFLRFVWKCMLCAAELPNLSKLMQHISIHLGREADCSCNSDSNFGKLAGDLAQDCHFCGESFLLFSDLDKHYRKHAGEEYWQCNKCRQIFSCLVDLKAHYDKDRHATGLGKSIKAHNGKSVPSGLLCRPIPGEKETPNHVTDFKVEMNYH